MVAVLLLLTKSTHPALLFLTGSCIGEWVSLILSHCFTTGCRKTSGRDAAGESCGRSLPKVDSGRGARCQLYNKVGPVSLVFGIFCIGIWYLIFERGARC